MKRKYLSNLLKVPPVHTSHLSLRTLDTEPAIRPDFVFAVSKKCGNAPTRNRIKRRLRAAIAMNIEDFRPGRVYMFTSRPGTDKIKFDRLVDEVKEICIVKPANK